MKTLEPPDNHHLNAAVGWLELGNQSEAREELGKISPALRDHPEVLEVQWGIHSFEKDWEACLTIGAALVGLAPEHSAGWRHRSVALHFMKRSREAYDLLFPALKKFPENWAVFYDMACYACVLGDLSEARTLLDKAFELGKKVSFPEARQGILVQRKSVMDLAKADPDLEPLWDEIGKWEERQPSGEAGN